MYKVKYSRYYENKEEEFDTKNEALAFAYYTNEYEEGFVVEIVDKYGNIIMDHEKLLELYAEFDEQIEKRKDSKKKTPVQNLNETGKGIIEAFEKGLERS